MSVDGSRCTGQPVSWLRLERHQLGELDAAERAAVDAHLAVCPACAACLAEARRPLTLRPLQLPAPAAATPASPPTAPLSLWDGIRRLLGQWLSFGAGPAGARARFTLAGAAVAAVALLVLARPAGTPVTVDPTTPAPAPAPPSDSHSKGGDLTLTLVRERQGVIAHEATTYAPGDRWKVLVTCPADDARPLFWDVVVLDGATPSFPLSPAAPINCGNHIPLPGAFRLPVAGPGRVDVCLIVASDPVDRLDLRRDLQRHLQQRLRQRPGALSGPAPAAEAAACTTLLPDGAPAP